MIYILGLVIFGFFVGCYGTLIGIGGGPLIVPLLILFSDLTPEEIIGTTLLIVFFNVLSGSVAYFRQRRVDIISGTKFGLATIPGAMLGTYMPRFFSMSFLSITFGVFMLILAVYVFVVSQEEDEPFLGMPRVRKAGGQLVQRVISDAQGHRFVYSFNEKLGIALSFLISSVATMFGIGGGVVHVPMLVRVLNFPVHIATATAHYKLAICALFGSIFYFYYGYVDLAVAVPMICGTICGAQMGARISKRFSGPNILRLLTLALVILAFRLLFLPG